MSMSVKVEKGNLVVTIPMAKNPAPSASGKTLGVATSHGNKETEVKVNGKTVYVGLNAYIYAHDRNGD